MEQVARRIRSSYEHWRDQAERLDRFWASRAEKSREGSEHPNVAGTELARFLDEGRNTAERGRLSNQRFLFLMLLQTHQLLGVE